MFVTKHYCAENNADGSCTNCERLEFKSGGEQRTTKSFHLSRADSLVFSRKKATAAPIAVTDEPRGSFLWVIDSLDVKVLARDINWNLVPVLVVHNLDMDRSSATATAASVDKFIGQHSYLLDEAHRIVQKRNLSYYNYFKFIIM
jgi:hypothetical protein